MVASKSAALVSTAFLCATVSCIERSPEPSSWQRTVDAIASLARQHEAVPEHLRREEAVKRGDEFDVNEYLSVLTHLSLPPGHVFDYVYCYGIIGGEPVIYSRQAASPPFRTCSEYREAEYGDVRPELDDLRYGFVDAVEVDDTPEGFFELIVLRSMGAQFYLFWHSIYNDHTIICDRAGLEAVLSVPQDAIGRSLLPPEVQRASRRLELEPKVTFEDDRVLVTVVFFTKWGGFKRATYTISRGYPHEIVEEGTEVLVEYDCGVVF
jgi:hypothetical protein